jgi:1-acyl-sn-glycerol-3-phosphate acyltransferase
MRSFLFNMLYYVFSTVFVLVCAFLAFVPGRKALMFGLSTYTKTMMFLMRWVAGIKVEIRGRERVPKDGPSIIAAKHQSWGDGFVMFSQFFDLSFVTGDHLEKYPLLGKILSKSGALVVDNCGGVAARISLAEQINAFKGTGRRVLIYPEGHLVPVGEQLRYRKGVYHLYEQMNCPVVPVATNLGLRWPQNDWTKHKGKAIVEFLAPIEPGLEKDAFMAQLENQVEQRSLALLAEARKGDAQ